jgi:molybdate transport system regulatory protein
MTAVSPIPRLEASPKDPPASLALFEALVAITTLPEARLFSSRPGFYFPGSSRLNVATRGHISKQPTKIAGPSGRLAKRIRDGHQISKAFILFAKGFDGNLVFEHKSKSSMARPSARSIPHLSLRIDLDAEERIGPGKIQLLEHIRDFGSISAAGRAMDMSYKRAWDLVEEINRICGHAAVARQTGGKNGGGAMLTPFGTSLVARYRKIERDAARAVRKELQALQTDIGRSRKA